MNILFIGDIVGRTGRTAVKKILPQLKQKYGVDFTIANGENLAGGTGMTFETYREMNEAGVDYFTSGNHIWKKADFVPNLDIKDVNVIRPANYADNVPGKGYVELKVNSIKLIIINLLGLVFMPEYLNNPFLEADKILSQYAISDKLFAIVDFHAEATSEKVCLGHYLDGRVSAIVGTHTHIPTADARVLPKGSAYITDVGMAGSFNSSIGDEAEPIIEHFKTGLPFKLEVAGPPAVVDGVLIKINDKTGLANEIVQIREIVD
ncbi:MAG: hypothetical protein ACD_58C00205G0002 [uncultured bacterium]|nr:MAG: hypothetical protein ACD_58C00205G0002 [uncultured bacterium]